MKKKPGPPKRSGSTVAAALPVVVAGVELNTSKLLTPGTFQILISVSDTNFFSTTNPPPTISDISRNRLYVRQPFNFAKNKLPDGTLELIFISSMFNPSFPYSAEARSNRTWSMAEYRKNSSTHFTLFLRGSLLLKRFLFCSDP
jgi:hypothetical protein